MADKVFLDVFEMEGVMDAITDAITNLQMSMFHYSDHDKSVRDWTLARIEFLRAIKEKIIVMNERAKS